MTNSMMMLMSRHLQDCFLDPLDPLPLDPRLMEPLMVPQAAFVSYCQSMLPMFPVIS